MGTINNILMAKPSLQYFRAGPECLPDRFKIVEIPGGCRGRDRLENVSGNADVYHNTELCRDVKFTVNGEVCAGFPSPAEEELRDVISFDEYLVSHPETSFLLSVTGDSMIGAGIMEKDLVIVERGRQPKNGDIILAEVDGNWTMKYLRKKGKTITLEAANPKYPPIVPQTELRIAGVITALVRKYHN
ncbi:MAG TPA: LexA family transcriptional regulator [Smithellaceae bacterium]|nr:LexA family transcriptional regulator [Smithellaceae bacterium]HPE06661.1 LexA family transcriptional regulator [Smithellaceae bacterium]HRY37386.1 LexA family transcriptional regulator [Smithellaceae bacterium]